MIKGAEKRGKVHTTPIAAREREEGELRQAQGSLVSGGSDDADERGRRWSFSFVYQCALCIRSVREREEPSSSLKR